MEGNINQQAQELNDQFDNMTLEEYLSMYYSDNNQATQSIRNSLSQGQNGNGQSNQGAEGQNQAQTQGQGQAQTQASQNTTNTNTNQANQNAANTNRFQGIDIDRNLLHVYREQGIIPHILPNQEEIDDELARRNYYLTFCQYLL